MLNLDILQEVTEWEDNTPNHTYALNDAGKLVGYRTADGEIRTGFVKPIRFEKRYRKFKKVVDKSLVDAILAV